MSWGTRCWLIAKVSLWHLEVRIQARLFSWELRINFPWDKQHSRASGAVQCKFVKKYVCTYVYYNAHCTGLFKSVQKPLLMQTALLEWGHTLSSTNLNLFIGHFSKHKFNPAYLIFFHALFKNIFEKFLITLICKFQEEKQVTFDSKYLHLLNDLLKWYYKNILEISKELLKPNFKFLGPCNQSIFFYS